MPLLQRRERKGNDVYICESMARVCNVHVIPACGGCISANFVCHPAPLSRARLMQLQSERALQKWQSTGKMHLELQISPHDSVISFGVHAAFRNQGRRQRARWFDHSCNFCHFFIIACRVCWIAFADVNILHALDPLSSFFADLFNSRYNF